MHVLRDVSLKLYSTMRLGGKATYLKDVHTKEELKAAVEWAISQQLPVIVIGQGSNIVWKDEGFAGLVLVNKLLGFSEVSSTELSSTYEIGAGEDWDATVGKITALRLSGVECLSLIPGSAGATPVQNVGAYGSEISNTLVQVEAYDSKENIFVTIPGKDCGFDYRTSRFKTADKGRFFITSITLKLNKKHLTPPFYAALQSYLDEHDITDYSPQTLREAVISIRKSKMPDWHVIANNGSFFANPIISAEKYKIMQNKFPELTGWAYKDGYKLSAGWLLETAGLKGYHDAETGMATSDKTALVLINEHAVSTEELLKFKQKITDKIQEMFGITLQQEPELLP